jgi:hypothetical protein
MDYKANFDFQKLIYRLPIPTWMWEHLYIPAWIREKYFPWLRERYFKITWETDYNVALSKAKETDKIVFALFRGSDWCDYCKILDKEVLNSLLFHVWAILKVVLLDIDFPMYTELPPGVATQNIKLYEKYNVPGLPTAIGLNPDGSERGRLVGYSKGIGPKAYLIQFETNTKMNLLPLSRKA